jgi:DNA polymerase-3 subunit epsilon
MQEQANLWEQPDLLGGGVMPGPGSTPPPPAPPAPALSPSPPVAPEQRPAPVPSVSLPSLPATAARGLPPVPERLLILDTETTALSPAEGQCIEVGAVLFHVPSRSVLSQVSFLLPAASNDAEPINGIAAAVTRLNQPWQAGLACFEAMVDGADALLAHNAAFDRQWFGHGPLPCLGKPWICSMEDIRWPAERRLRAVPSVIDLALAYGVPVWAAHRALTDCIYLAQVMERCSDLEMLLQAGLEPRRIYRACLSYDERHRAREAGFRWNQPVSGAWSRRLSDREVEALPFRVQPVTIDGEGGGMASSSGDSLSRLPRPA